MLKFDLFLSNLVLAFIQHHLKRRNREGGKTY